MASWLDVKLGARMLAKYPGLTLVAGLAIMVAIALGAVFDIAAGVVGATLPFEEGDRIVAIEQWDLERNNQTPRILHDFATWRDELRTVRELGAYRTIDRNLIVPGAPVQLVRVAEMSAAGFDVARVPPLMGRTLHADDERADAPPVLVIGAEVWRARFQSDPAVVGREVRLGDTAHTIVGVMPEGFAFPMNHRLWIPLRANPLEYARGQGPALAIFGRLAPGATLPQAQAELTTLSASAAATFPETHAHLRAHVLPYTAQLFDDMQGWEITAVRVLLALLLAVLCVNVAVLFYARTAARQGELAVRTALGASRTRIVAQLFVEAALLSTGAAAAGLLVAALSIDRLNAFIATLSGPLMGGVPFWIDLTLSPRTVAYALSLAAVAAFVVGVVPGLSATGRRLPSRLGQHGAALHLGKTWNALIVAQVAFAAAVLPTTILFASTFVRFGTADPGFAADEFLTATLVMDPDDGRADQSRYAARLNDVVSRLEAAPEVTDVTFASDLPGQEPTVRVQFEGSSTHQTRSSSVAADFFDAFGARLLAGRLFRSNDRGDADTAVVVNATFARAVPGGELPVGRRLEYVEGYQTGGVTRLPAGTELGRSYEIVGVVDDVPPTAMQPGETAARVYHLLRPGTVYPVKLALHTRDVPATFAGPLQEIGISLDPTLQMHDVVPLGDVMRVFQRGMRLGGVALALTTVSVLLLCAAGTYALMSFTVTQRRREIGLRIALGASPRQVVRAIGGRAARQVAIGLSLGLAVGVLFDVAIEGTGPLGGQRRLLMPLVAGAIALVSVLAALGPARRGLRLEPNETLKGEIHT